MKNWNLRKREEGQWTKARFEHNMENFSKMMKDINVQI